MSTGDIQIWMFKENKEGLYLIISIIIVLIIGYIFTQLNFLITISLLIIGYITIRLQQAQLIGNALEINEFQFPEIYEVFKIHKTRLGLNKVNLYIKQNPEPNAFTIGFPRASIVLTSALVENFTNKELSFTIAHELGHVKAGHNIVLTFINPLGNGVFGASTVFSFWQRTAEYTSDKCGLVLTREIEPAVSSLLKLSVGLHLWKKINLDRYKDQLVESENKVVRASEILFDHPLTTNRVKKMVNFWKENFIRNKL